MQDCRILYRAAAAALVVACIGCSKNPRVVPVSGTVKFPDGKPLAGGWVEFRPSDAAVTHSARGLISDDGRFRLTTFSSGDGALPGKHRALIVPPEPTGSVELGEGGAFPQVIDRKLRSFETSSLEFTISEDVANNHFEIVVQRPGS